MVIKPKITIWMVKQEVENIKVKMNDCLSEDFMPVCNVSDAVSRGCKSIKSIMWSLATDGFDDQVVSRQEFNKNSGGLYPVLVLIKE